MSKSKSNKNLNPGKHSKRVSDMKETRKEGVGFFTKASELKPFKPIRDTSRESRRHKDNLLAGHKSGSSRQKLDQWLNKCSTSKSIVHKDSREKKRSGEGSSGGNLGNISPGDSAGVKDVANVVVKYLFPYLKQGSIVSKVRTTHQTNRTCESTAEEVKFEFYSTSRFHPKGQTLELHTLQILSCVSTYGTAEEVPI